MPIFWPPTHDPRFFCSLGRPGAILRIWRHSSFLFPSYKWTDIHTLRHTNRIVSGQHLKFFPSCTAPCENNWTDQDLVWCESSWVGSSPIVLHGGLSGPIVLHGGLNLLTGREKARGKFCSLYTIHIGIFQVIHKMAPQSMWPSLNYCTVATYIMFKLCQF